MSRIGRRKLLIPEGIEVNINGNEIVAKNSKGELKLVVCDLIKLKVEDNRILIENKVDSKEANIMQGTTNSLIKGMLDGLSQGYEKSLETVGVGYRFNVQGKKIIVNAGYSSPLEVEVPDDLTVELVSNTEITIKGIDKQKVMEFAAKVRKIREPEPYKGKGIRYKGEYVRRKEGKKAA